LLPAATPDIQPQELPPLTATAPELGLDDALLASLEQVAPAQADAALAAELAAFNPEAWTPPNEANAPATTAEADAPSAPDAQPLRVGDQAPDLELMLDAMFDAPLPAAPQPPAPNAPAAPAWSLADDDYALAPTAERTATSQAQAQDFDFSGLELEPLQHDAEATATATAELRQPREITRVIAIGASIGGPDAVRTFLGTLPPGLPLVVVVAQHLDEAFFQGFAEQLRRALPHPVTVAREGLRLQAGEVLLLPPNLQLQLDPDAVVHVQPAQFLHLGAVPVL